MIQHHHCTIFIDYEGLDFLDPAGKSVGAILRHEPIDPSKVPTASHPDTPAIPATCSGLYRYRQSGSN